VIFRQNTGRDNFDGSGRRKFSHTDIQEDTKPHHIGNHRRPAIGDKGQRDTHNRHQTHDHPDIDEYLPEDHGGHTKGQNGTKHIPAVIGNVQPPEQEKKIQE
jgi:hypothetical protein